MPWVASECSMPAGRHRSCLRRRGPRPFSIERHQSRRTLLPHRHAGYGLVGLPARRALHRELSLKACRVAIDRSNGKYAALALVFEQAVPARDLAFDGNLIPLLSM